MKSFIAILALVALVPFAALGGYGLNSDPAPPPPLTVKSTVERDLKVLEGSQSEEWLFVVTKGVLTGQVADAGYVAMSLSKQALREQGVKAGKYLVRKCALYSTSGKQNVATDPVVVHLCRQSETTKKAVLEHVKQAIATPSVS